MEVWRRFSEVSRKASLLSPLRAEREISRAIFPAFRRNVSFGSMEDNCYNPHPVRDASLTGCKENTFRFSTERSIPDGMQIAKSCAVRSVLASHAHYAVL